MNYLSKKIFVAGATGMVGSAIVRELRERGCFHIITRGSSDLDLTGQAAVERFFADEKPEVVILAAAKVGGILANDTYRGDFIYQNLMIEANVIDAALRNDTEKLIFLGSSCIYPKMAAQPMPEEALLTGPLEPTNEPYAIAKIAGIKMCESYYHQYGSNFYSAMPTNLFGPFDNFDLDSSHVLPALMRKFHEAKLALRDDVTVWGTGTPRREFLYVDDLAKAIVFLLENVDAVHVYGQGISHLNVGSGQDVSIAEAAELMKDIVGFKGAIQYDATKPDGTPRKLMNVDRMTAMGWRYNTSLAEGLSRTYEWFLDEFSSIPAELKDNR